MRAVYLLLWSACALSPVWAGGVQARAPIAIELRPSALIAAPRVTLSDVAQSAAPALQGIDLGLAPRVGYVERLSRQQIEHIVRRRLAADAAPFVWSGADSVAVRVQSQTVGADMLAAAAIAAVTAPSGQARVQARLTAQPAEVEVPAGALTIEARRAAGPVLAPRMALWLDLAVNGMLYRSVMVPLAVSVRQRAYVARRDLEQGAQAEETDFAVAEAEVAGVEALEVGGQFAPFRLRQRLKAGQVLASAAVGARARVLRGDRVNVVIRHGQIGIETGAVAMAEAEPGQLLAVRPKGGSDIVTGRLDAAGTVNIE